jgi:hypothetical protein
MLITFVTTSDSKTKNVSLQDTRDAFSFFQSISRILKRHFDFKLKASVRSLSSQLDPYHQHG